MLTSLLGRNGEILSVYQSLQVWGWKLLTGLPHTMVFVRRPFFHYDPARCGMPTLYGTVSERAAKTIRFNTLWQWKRYKKIFQRFKGLTAKLFNWNFHSFEVVSRWRDPQLQASENYADLTKWRSTIFKSYWLMSRFIFNMFKSWYTMC